VAEYADSSGNSEKSGVRVPSRRVHLFPDLRFASPVAIEESYFLDTESRAGNPAGVAALRDGGVVPKHKIPQEMRSETLFADSPVMHTITMHSIGPVA
jgi:hypothetical protein